MLIAVFAAALVMTLLVTAPIVHRGLRPLRNTAKLIELVDSRTLGTRLEVASAPAEIVPIIERLNELLDRLNQAFRREREFSSNVAHELRTPLTGLRTTIEVALSSQRDPAGYQRSLATCLEICRQTQCVIENLLSLARVDAGVCKVHQELADVNALIHDTWTAFAMRAASRQLRVVWRNDPRLVVSVDVEKLRLILMNLFDNAVSYCDTEGEIGVATHASDGELVFQSRIPAAKSQSMMSARS